MAYYRIQFTEGRNLTNILKYFKTFKIPTKIMLEIKFEIYFKGTET